MVFGILEFLGFNWDLTYLHLVHLSWGFFHESQLFFHKTMLVSQYLIFLYKLLLKGNLFGNIYESCQCVHILEIDAFFLYNHLPCNDSPSLPNSSTPRAAKMKKSRKNKSPRFPTCTIWIFKSLFKLLSPVAGPAWPCRVKPGFLWPF